MQRADEDRARYGQWFIFHEFENREYARQYRFTEYRLFKTQDVIDLFSNHAQRHVEEVMEQCLMMFRSLHDWIFARLPGVDGDEMLRHLLTAAKLHDICMSPAPEILESLSITDRMYKMAMTGHMDPESMRTQCMELEKLAAKSELADKKTLKVICVLCRTAVMSRETVRKLADTLVAYHDKIKQYVRKNHASLGALYVLDHAQTIREYYGAQLDVAMVASIIALHSTSSSGCKAIGFDDETARNNTRNCLKTLFSRRGTEIPHNEGWLNQVVMLASILRLADARRSGSRLTMLDDTRLFCLKDKEQAELFIEKESGMERITNRKTHDILLSEYCTDFGAIRLCHDGNGWKIIHQLFVREWQHKEIWQLFCEIRLESYINEIMTGEFKANAQMEHRLDIWLSVNETTEIKPKIVGRAMEQKYIRVNLQESLF